MSKGKRLLITGRLFYKRCELRAREVKSRWGMGQRAGGGGENHSNNQAAKKKRGVDERLQEKS